MQTMGEFASLTERLALMPDPALQQFAQMHKDDPFTLSLAVSESNRRRKLRTAQQGAAGAQPQPPVADQEIAAMNAPVMPENVGIGALPAPSMAGMPAGGITGEEEQTQAPAMMAGGGMVAFAHGGDVERYQFGGATGLLSKFLQATGQTKAYAYGTAAEKAAIEAAFQAATGMYGPSAPAAATTAAPATAVSATNPALSRLLAGVGAAGVATIPIGIASELTSAMDKMRDAGYPVDTTAPEFATEPTPEQMAFDEARRRQAVAGMSREDKLRQFGTEDVEQALKTPAAASAPARATGSPSGPRNSPAMVFPPAAEQLRLAASGQTIPTGPGAGGPAPVRGPGAGGPAAGAAGPGGLDVNALTAAALKAAEEKPDPNAAELKDLIKERVAAREKEVTGLEAIQKQFADISKGKKERLDTKEAELGKMKDQGLGLALLQAGAAMMSTPGGFGVALGKGVKVGTEQYAAGLDKLRSAQEKLSDARDRLEEIDAQRGELSAREIFKARNEVTNTMLSGREDLIKSRMLATKENRETAMKQVDNQIKVGIAQLETSGREKVANITAGATRELTAATRLPALLETTRKNIAAEAIKKFPYDAAGRAAYEKQAFAEALRTNPALAQYAGVAGGGGAPSADLRFDEKTGQFVPMR